MSETYQIPTLRQSPPAEAASAPQTPATLKKPALSSSYRRATTKAELGVHLFACGFKDMSRAGVLLYAIWQFSPLDAVLVRETKDTVEVNFAFLRLRGVSMGVPKYSKGHQGRTENSEEHVAFLLNKLEKLTIPYTVEVNYSPFELVSNIRILFVKNQVLALVDEKIAWLTRRQDNWAQVRQSFKTALLDDAGEMDRALVGTILLQPKPHLDWIDFRGYWAYHRASFSIRTDELRCTVLGRAIRTYPKEVRERYRFLVVNHPDKRSVVTVLRKQNVD